MNNKRKYNLKTTSSPKFTSAFNEKSIARLLAKHGYLLSKKDTAEVTKFVLANPDMLNDLKLTPDAVRKYFNNFKLRLELYTDHVEKYSVLYILIENELSVQEAFAKERELFRGFFKTIYTRNKGKITISQTGRN